VLSHKKSAYFQDQNELSKLLRKLLLTWDYIIKDKSVVHQHQTTTTAVNSISMIQSIVSIEPNEKDSNVL
jgi:hypothetical protein